MVKMILVTNDITTAHMNYTEPNYLKQFLPGHLVYRTLREAQKDLADPVQKHRQSLLIMNNLIFIQIIFRASVIKRVTHNV